jgi:membrane fusion protein, multidrug efflux system
MRTMWKIIIPLLIIVLGVAMMRFFITSKQQPERKPLVIIPPTVALFPAQPQQRVVTISTQGVVRPRATSVLGAEVGGRVAWINPALATGVAVASGEELLRLDNTDYLAAHAEAEAQLSLRRKEYAEEQAEAARAQREWSALGQGDANDLVLRKPQLAAIQARIIAAEAAVKKATADMERCTVRAPYAARITRKNIDLGSRVTPAGELLTLEAADIYEVALPISLEQLRYLSLPLRGEVVDNGPRVTFQARIGGKLAAWSGRIVRTEAHVSEQTRMIHALARIEPSAEEKSQVVMTGLFLSAIIHGETIPDAVELPLSALQTDDELFVFRAKDSAAPATTAAAGQTTADGTVEKRSATIIERRENTVIVQGNFAPGDLVVINQFAGIRDGMAARRDVMAPESNAPSNKTTAPETAPVAP